MNIPTNRAVSGNFAIAQDPGTSVGGLRWLWAAWRRRRARARASRELLMLDDRQLADIGLERAKIYASGSRPLITLPGGGHFLESKAGLMPIYSRDGPAGPRSSRLP